MRTEIVPPPILFGLLEAAEIHKKDIAFRLGVSKTLVTFWSQGKRAMTAPDYEALLALAFDPATVQKIAQKLKAHGVIPVKGRAFEITPQYLVYKLTWLAGYRQALASVEISQITEELATGTRKSDVLWDIA